jgi:hypothetical protein
MRVILFCFLFTQSLLAFAGDSSCEAQVQAVVKVYECDYNKYHQLTLFQKIIRIQDGVVIFTAELSNSYVDFGTCQNDARRYNVGIR